LNDQRLFIGGKNDMILHYCKKFSSSDYCQGLRNKYTTSTVDKGINKIASDPNKLDSLIDKLTKNI